MKTIHIIYTTLLLMLCSCGGISENKALKIAGNTPGFNESLYRLFTVGDHWCLSDSTYINQAQDTMFAGVKQMMYINRTSKPFTSCRNGKIWITIRLLWI